MAPHVSVEHLRCKLLGVLQIDQQPPLTRLPGHAELRERKGVRGGMGIRAYVREMKQEERSKQDQTNNIDGKSLLVKKYI